jgi:hypothetical protein
MSGKAHGNVLNYAAVVSFDTTSSLLFTYRPVNRRDTI